MGKLCERCCFYICTGKHCECGAATNAAQPLLMCNICSWMMRCACGRICTQFCATMCCRLCCKDWGCQVHIAYNNVNKNTVKGFDSSIPDSTLSILLNYQSENVSNESLNKNLLEDLFLAPHEPTTSTNDHIPSVENVQEYSSHVLEDDTNSSCPTDPSDTVECPTKPWNHVPGIERMFYVRCPTSQKRRKHFILKLFEKYCTVQEVSEIDSFSFSVVIDEKATFGIYDLIYTNLLCKYNVDSLDDTLYIEPYSTYMSKKTASHA